MSLGLLCSSGTTCFPFAAASLWKSRPATACPALHEICYPLEPELLAENSDHNMLLLELILTVSFALAVHRGMRWWNGCVLYLDIFYSFSRSYTPNIEWFSDLPGISITHERFFQYSETINYQTTNIFYSNKYHLEKKEKKIERLLSSAEGTLWCSKRR